MKVLGTNAGRGTSRLEPACNLPWPPAPHINEGTISHTVKA